MNYDDISEQEVTVKIESQHPSPLKFEEYLTWACTQFQLPYIPVFKRVEQVCYGPQPSVKGYKSAIQKAAVNISKSTSDTEESRVWGSMSQKKGDKKPSEKEVYIDTVYDNNNNLVQLKLVRNGTVPDTLLKLISFIIHFQPRLIAIYIDSGLNQSSLYDLWKVLTLSKITEVTLDNTIIRQGNYYILLDKTPLLKYLSLARCQINDKVIENIAIRLKGSMSTVQNLCALNLASNQITDLGAKYLGEALKRNRSLTYLNLSGNMITDLGSKCILDSLQEFPLSSEDVVNMRRNRYSYLKKLNTLINKTADEMREALIDKKKSKKKSPQKPHASTSARKIRALDKVSQSSFVEIDKTMYGKAEIAAEMALGKFTDIFTSDNTITRDGIFYCIGNNTLSYLNLAYNNLTYLSLEYIYKVMCTQHLLDRKPKGLMKICLDGNNLPETCDELTEIEFMFGLTLYGNQRVSTTIKRKATSANK